MRYIDVDKLYKALTYRPLTKCGTFTEHFCNYVDNSIKRFIEETIENQPTADVVKVVRCKNCIRKLDEVNQCGDIYCNLHKGYFDQNAFCSYGEGSDTE